MNMQLVDRLLLMAAGGLAVAGLIFLGLTLFADKQSLLWPGFSCVALGNLFSLIRLLFKRNGE